MIDQEPEQIDYWNTGASFPIEILSYSFKLALNATMTIISLKLLSSVR